MKAFKNVDAYIAQADKAHQSKLKEVRGVVKEVALEAIEKISYGMPAYTWKDKQLFYFAAMKGHLGVYPTPGPIQECKDVLKDFFTSKGCVRVPYDVAVPKRVITALLKARMREIKQEIKSKK